MTSNQVFENCQLEESHWKINYIVTTEYCILAKNQHSIFIFHYFNAKLLGKHSQTPIWQLCDSCQILDLINFQNTLTWPNSNTAGISLNSRLKYSKITHRYAAKNSPFTWFLYWKLPTDTDFIHFICQFHQSWGINARECFHGPVAPQPGMLGALIVWWPASFWLQWTMTEGTVHASSPAKFPTKSTEKWKKENVCYKTN